MAFASGRSQQPIANGPEAAGQAQVLPKSEPTARGITTVRQPGNRAVTKAKTELGEVDCGARVQGADQAPKHENHRQSPQQAHRPSDCALAPSSRLIACDPAGQPFDRQEKTQSVPCSVHGPNRPSRQRSNGPDGEQDHGVDQPFRHSVGPLIETGRSGLVGMNAAGRMTRAGCE